MTVRKVLTQARDGDTYCESSIAAHHLIVREGDQFTDPKSQTYEVSSLIGYGGFAFVYEAIGLNDNVKYALKINKTGELCCAEIGALDCLKDVDCCSLIRMITHFTLDTHVFIVLERCCCDFRTLVTIRRGFPMDLVRSVMRDMIEALRMLNNFGYVHCDLKPDNLLLVDQEARSVKLADFGGIQREVVGLPKYACTLWYRAPEIHLRKMICYKSDVWSLGCLAFELAIGVPLFLAVDEYQLLALVQERLGEKFPAEFIDGCPDRDLFFDKNGELTHQEYYRRTGRPVASFARYFKTPLLTEIVKRRELSETLSQGERVSEAKQRVEFTDLLLHMLKIDVSQRYSIEDVAEHEFFKHP